MSETVILLNGPSSSGKSTLARALKEAAADKRYEIVSIDDFMKISPFETIYEDDVYEISPLLCAKIRELLENGRNVIVDHVITSERIWRQTVDAAEGYRLITVFVTCSVEELRRREISRGDRKVGTAENALAYLYPRDGYDLTLDTSALSADVCLEKLLLL